MTGVDMAYDLEDDDETSDQPSSDTFDVDENGGIKIHSDTLASALGQIYRFRWLNPEHPFHTLTPNQPIGGYDQIIDFNQP